MNLPCPAAPPRPSFPLVPFCKLADVSRYVACSWDLSVDDEGRMYWVTFFKSHLNTILGLGVAAAVRRGEVESSAAARANLCRTEFYACFDAYAAAPRDYGRVTIFTLDEWRDDFLRAHGFVDAFIDLKDRENEKVLPTLPVVCRELDALEGRERFRALVLGVFAGNIFDMGAAATAKAFLGAGHDFFETRRSLSPRPWLIDDYDRLERRMLGGPAYRKAVFFIDNAGSDFVLGVLPMARWLAERGTRVVLAANERPTLNDMTVHDVAAWWPRLLAAEPSLARLSISRVTTGTGEPLIDLAGVSPELNEMAADADLVVIEGMGRGVESNLDAVFDCDALNIAMIKDEAVARRNGGKVFDVVCRFRGAGE